MATKDIYVIVMFYLLIYGKCSASPDWRLEQIKMLLNYVIKRHGCRAHGEVLLM